jgi:hypothetical protein
VEICVVKVGEIVGVRVNVGVVVNVIVENPKATTFIPHSLLGELSPDGAKLKALTW